MRIYYLFAACGLIAACAKKPHASPSAGDSANSVDSANSAIQSNSLQATTNAALPAQSNHNATAPLPANPRDISALFQTEAASRPSGTIRVEDALAAFRKDGIQVEDVKQHLGRPYGARYCVGTQLSHLVAISLCEYVDAAAATAGAVVSEKIPLPNREIHINQATSLTVRDLEKSPAADALAKRLFESFARIKQS